MSSQLKHLFFTLMVARAWCVSNAQAQHLHAVFVVDNHDPSIGESVLVDGQSMFDWIPTMRLGAFN